MKRLCWQHGRELGAMVETRYGLRFVCEAYVTQSDRIIILAVKNRFQLKIELESRHEVTVLVEF